MESLKTYSKLVLQTNFNVDPNTECWLFNGNIRPNGYGYIGFRKKTYSIHRLSAWIWLGLDLGSSKQVNHKTICPNRHCFNPEHLYIGTQSQNLTDYYNSINTGTCPRGHSKESMYEYTSKDGKKFRWCRQCRREARHKYWKEKGK